MIMNDINNLAEYLESKSRFKRLTLPYANLENANLDGLNLKDADLSCVNFSNASLRNVDLAHSNLRGTWIVF